MLNENTVSFCYQNVGTPKLRNQTNDRGELKNSALQVSKVSS